jgi:malate dehydrogenase
MKKSTHKVTVIGAGAVGATLAQRIFEAGLADVVLVDILKHIACGKALDLIDAASITGTEQTIVGTDNYKDIQGSDIVVITAGLPRKPGMSREDLIAKNAAIIRDVCGHIKTHAPGAIVIVVTNPLDSMTYLAWKLTGFPKERVFGMAGVLDGSRFIGLLADHLRVTRASIETYVLGSHGDTMVPVVSKTLVSGKPVSEAIPEDALEKIVKRTCDRGAEIVSLLGNGSAYYSPSAAVFAMVNAILNDTKTVMTASAHLSGEYGLKDIFIGVPCKIGRAGIEKIVELALSSDEKTALANSAQAIKNTNVLL